MATKLKNLKIKKVDFVDEGANPDADIKMKKRKDKEELKENRVKSAGNILKSLFSFIGKAAGIEQSEIDSAIDEIQKGDSISFNEKINEVNNRKISDEMWDVCYALQSSLCSILNDDEMDSTSSAVAMQESLDEFYAVVKESIAQWSNGKETSVVRKNEEISEIDLEVMKAAMERLSKSIEKADRDISKKGNPKGNGLNDSRKEKGDREEMIDKSKMTDAERAFLESIEKRYGTDDESISDNGSGEAMPVPSSAEPKINKSIVPAAQEPITAMEDTDSIYKGLHPAVKAELESLKKFREDAEEKELINIAKKYAIIGKKEEELVPLFKSLKAAGGTAYDDMIAVLDQAVVTVEKSGVFSEIGKSGHGSSNESAWAEAEVKATELMKSKTGLSKAQALDEIFMTNPELAERCEKED